MPDGRPRLQKIRGFVLDKATGKPLRGVEVSAVAELDGGRRIPLGLLASDAAGYVSFDLGDLAETPAVRTLQVAANGDEAARVDLAVEDATGATGLRFLLKVDAKLAAPPHAPANLPSVQRPDVTDWELSPGSFGLRQGLALGEGGCEVLVPSREAVHEYRFYQLVRRPARRPDDRYGRAELRSAVIGPTGLAIEPLDPARVTPAPSGEQPILEADLLEFRQIWYPTGHSLGEIVYSLPLAPCESVNLAVIEWARTDTAMRTEAIVSREALLHSQRRDRTIAEVVNTALREYQGGFSLMAGAAQVWTGGIGVVGGATSHSWGARDLTGSSVQRLDDLTAQATTAVRSLNSTVIVQASQQEREALQTRTITNHNHCHAMTVQFYEVLRHFKVVTEYVGLQRVVLVPFKMLAFTWELALRYRTILERVLLDPRLARGFDALVRLHLCPQVYVAGRPVAPAAGSPSAPADAAPTRQPTPAARTIARYELSLRTGDRETWGAIWVRLGLRNGQWKELYSKDSVNSQGGAFPSGRTIAEYSLQRHSTKVVDITSGEAIGIDPADVERVKVVWSESNGNDAWAFDGIRIRYQLSGQSGLVAEPLVDLQGDPHLKRFDDGVQLEWIGDATPPAPADTGPQPESAPPSQPPAEAPSAGPAPSPQPAAAAPAVREEDECDEQALLAHLNANLAHYNRAIWLLQDADERTLLLDQALGHLALRDLMDTTPVAVSGSYVAFPYHPPADDGERPRPKPRARILSLPTRGVFAESMLSNCNACEKRDVTRFWRWEESPCPERAPTIEGVRPGSRAQQPQVQPSAMPAPVVQVMQAPAAPDPTGLAAAMAVLGRPGIFRDMSGIEELQQLLSGLVSGAVDLETARQLAQKANAGLAQQALGATGPGSAPSSRGPSASDLYDRVQVAEAAAQAAERIGGGGGPLSTASRIFTDMVLGATGGGAGGAVAGPAIEAAGELAKAALGIFGEVYKELLKTSSIAVNGPQKAHVLLRGHPNPDDYLPDGKSLSQVLHKLYIDFDKLGRNTLGEGLSGRLEVRWYDECVLRGETRLADLPAFMRDTGIVWFKKGITVDPYVLQLDSEAIQRATVNLELLEYGVDVDRQKGLGKVLAALRITLSLEPKPAAVGNRDPLVWSRTLTLDWLDPAVEPLRIKAVKFGPGLYEQEEL
ncbi:MAG TPA: hypothetical protein VNM66_04215 [Thermodesulfobacteriota bacterium]|nr:hypothetical protein [Thermodesulfobacteriota bacterium]